MFGRWSLTCGVPLVAAALLLWAPARSPAEYPGYGFGGGWYWANVNWPSPVYHFTYGPPMRSGYRVFYPSERLDGDSYYVSPSGFLEASLGKPVQIEVRVPAYAEVWVEGEKTTQAGIYRQYSSPPLAPDRDYVYEIRAHWKDGDRDYSPVRTITVHGGSRVHVDFLIAQPAIAPPPKPGL